MRFWYAVHRFVILWLWFWLIRFIILISVGFVYAFFYLSLLIILLMIWNLIFFFSNSDTALQCRRNDSDQMKRTRILHKFITNSDADKAIHLFKLPFQSIERRLCSKCTDSIIEWFLLEASLAWSDIVSSNRSTKLCTNNNTEHFNPAIANCLHIRLENRKKKHIVRKRHSQSARETLGQKGEKEEEKKLNEIIRIARRFDLITPNHAAV